MFEDLEEWKKIDVKMSKTCAMSVNEVRVQSPTYITMQTVEQPHRVGDL